MWDDPPSKPGAHWCPLVPTGVHWFHFFLPCHALPLLQFLGMVHWISLRKMGLKQLRNGSFFRSSLHVVPIDSVFFLNQQEPQKQLPSSKPTVCYGKCSLKMVTFHRIVSRSPMISALFQSRKISKNSRRDVWGHHLAFETWITITWRSPDRARNSLGDFSTREDRCWFVVWNMNFIFPYIGNSNPK